MREVSSIGIGQTDACHIGYKLRRAMLRAHAVLEQTG
jgi:hypothetical protein